MTAVSRLVWLAGAMSVLAVSQTATAANSEPLPALQVKVPRYSDPLAGLYPLPASTVPRDVELGYYRPGGKSGKPGRAVLTMALVPGANAQKTNAYLAEVAQRAGGDNAQAMYLQLQPVLTRAVQIIRDRYPWIELTNDLAATTKNDTSLTFVLDIRSRIGMPKGEPTALQIDVTAFDDSHQPVGRYVVEGRSDAGTTGYGFQAAAKQALDAFESAAKGYFN